MGVQLYNTLSRKKVALVPLRDNFVGIYTCGPTVYWFAHIGNLRSYIFADLLRRVLLQNGYQINHLVNITDVGHLTEDNDEGEDKMIIAMRREGKSAEEIARFYERAFLNDAAKLNILPAAQYPRATEHIGEQIDLIKQIEGNGYSYRTSSGIYFDTAKLKKYGVLSGQSIKDKLFGARVPVGEKHQGSDFALWKFSPSDSKREMEWDSPWGRGFPGWSVECSAMAKKYLGVPFDIHTGGIDHIPVHHENEIAQIMASDDILEANIWMHNEFLTVDGQKMSKSLQNIYTLADLQARGFGPMAYRYFIISAHYRTLLNFTFEALAAANNALTKLQNLARGFVVGEAGDSKYEERFIKALGDDLNAPFAISILWEMVSDSNISPEIKGKSLLYFDEILALGLRDYIGQAENVPEQIKVLVALREKVRQANDWEKADALRKEIEALGWQVEDTVSGARPRKLKNYSV